VGVRTAVLIPTPFFPSPCCLGGFAVHPRNPRRDQHPFRVVLIAAQANGAPSSTRIGSCTPPVHTTDTRHCSPERTELQVARQCERRCESANVQVELDFLPVRHRANGTSRNRSDPSESVEITSISFRPIQTGTMVRGIEIAFRVEPSAPRTSHC